MASGFLAWGSGAKIVLQRATLGLLLLLAITASAHAADKAKLFATTEQGFARVILDFPSRLELPPYKIHSDNGVLSIEFESPVDFTLPDVAAALPDYVTIARVDPDGRGIRFGLRATMTINHIEAGEQLFVDMMPASWRGLPPSLPQEVIASLSQRAKDAALKAEQDRKAAQAKIDNPVATVRVGRNPSFMRVELSWSTDTEGRYHFDGKDGTIDFDWPVPIDLYLLKIGLPKELLGVENKVDETGSHLIFHAADKVTPRFYAVSNRDFIVDIDTASTVPANPDPAAGATAKAVADAMAGTPIRGAPWWVPPAGAAAWDAAMVPGGTASPQPPITPVVATIGSTIRVTFPFDRDTPAAVFRRGDTVWMLFDTLTGIKQPPFTPDLAALASSFTIVPAGDEQVVRLDLSTERLATLGSEGKSWVLSLGDMLLAPTEPLTLSHGTNAGGLGEVTADLERPASVHLFHDPVVGDTLTVVTAYPPARGVIRDLEFVDFEALRSVHGLVIKPEHDDVSVKIAGKLAVIGAPGGLIVSTAEAVRNSNGGDLTTSREGFIDLASLKEDNPVKFSTAAEDKTLAASRADGRDRDVARLDLARFYLANQFGYEAIGVLRMMQGELKSDDLKTDAQLLLAAADVASGRPADALPILNAETFADEVDAQVWRAVAKTDSGDFKGARVDVLAAEPVIATYPKWVRLKFALSGVRAAVETGDTALGERLLKGIDFADLDSEQVTLYQLLSGRLAEAEGRASEALDTYGQVIAADIRPTRAEAIFRTILILDQSGRVDPAKATRTLAAEALLWRGNALESQMDALLAELYFRSGDYRSAFETVKQTVEFFPASPAMDALSAKAQDEFEALYLNGKADQLPPVEALSLYYDFRTLTPPGARGDEMIRNLAARLVKVDLLSQAADLLRYQIENRLKGAAQAEIATELAVIEIANRKPEDALRVLTSTELADLPPSLERQRRILQARALIDSNRNDLALDLLTSITGRDADLLRVEANWNSKYFEDAGNLLEVMYSPGDGNSSGPELTQAGRMNLVRAGVAFALANDRIGLSRLRSKFGEVMGKAAEWPMFDYVTAQIEPVSSPEFKKVARAVSGIDTLDAFLASYRQTYGGSDGIAPASAGAADGSAAAAATPPTAPVPAG